MLTVFRLRKAPRIARSFAERVAVWIQENGARRQGSASGADALEANASSFFVAQVRGEALKINGPVFTILIPTMDRAATVVDTIRTCLSQEDENLRIIVSDNASTDDTMEVVRSFSDARLSYINPGRRLGMSEHWEFALAYVPDG